MPERVSMPVSGARVPPTLKELDIWTVWDCREKQPLAPWVTGHMYPAKWGSDTPAEQRPEATFDRAKAIADLGPDTIHATYPFPDVSDLPDEVKPGVILPHEPDFEPNLMLVDFDDVRDPETGSVPQEVADIIDRLGAYAEVSRSGTGLHCYVFANLPDTLGKFIADLDTEGHIELYDHGRFTGGTWLHAEGTSLEVPECQDTIDELIKTYETEDIRRRRLRETDPEPRDIDDVLAEIRNGDSGSGDNAYFRLDTESVATTGYFSRYGSESGRGWINGPHPEHGSLSGGGHETCTNFGVNPHENYWKCWLHDTAGSALHLIAVIEGVVDCEDVRRLTDDPQKLLKTCLLARDQYATGRLDGEDPPYSALVGVAQLADLVMADEDSEKLGRDCWRIARVIYEEMDASDVPA